MYLRLVQAKLKAGAIPQLQKAYEDTIIPALEKTPGCLCACLIKSDVSDEEGISMTLWDSLENATQYEESGMYQKLLGSVKPYLSDSSEWKIQLSKDMKLEYQPIPEEPSVKSFGTIAEKDTKITEIEKKPQMYLRILNIHVKKNKMDELKDIYLNVIIPALQSVKGCNYAYLTENTEVKNEAISFTIWDSKEDSDRYEKSGLFKELLNKFKHTFSELYQWKMTLDNSSRRKMITSDDADVGRYSFLTGKSFD